MYNGWWYKRDGYNHSPGPDEMPKNTQHSTLVNCYKFFVVVHLHKFVAFVIISICPFQLLWLMSRKGSWYDRVITNKICSSWLRYYVACFLASRQGRENGWVFVSKSRYVDCLINELCIDNSLGKLYIYPDDNCERGNPGHSQCGCKPPTANLYQEMFIIQSKSCNYGNQFNIV
jgi:hypothetical protein